MTSSLTQLAYVVAAVLFIVGLKRMSHPRTAVQGNVVGITGMGLAILLALTSGQLEHHWLIGIGLLVGTAIGIGFALTVKMTDMPQMVALFNGFGGAASVLVAAAALLHDKADTVSSRTAVGISGVIGAITFWGSLVAFGKLQELDLFKKPIDFPYKQPVTIGIACLMLLLTVLLGLGSGHWLFVPTVLLASAIGILLVNPIGGADMPVVIALLNSYSGLAAAATGFVINNHVLVISGSLVGASGIILTRLMCKAMNRSLSNVLFGVMATGNNDGDDDIYENVQITTADNVALMLEAAQRIVFVPGYGMAVAQAQHAVRNLSKILEAQQTTVEYAIHPVAGRMPGHMNVLLAEADVPYDQLIEMDQINPTMDNVDVAIVLGANDVVNPVARTDPQSPIAGMPIIDVDQARIVIVIKRSLSAGFAGIPNPLFANSNTWMLFGDGQQAVLDITTAITDG
ncbi:MAG: NAD(P)(+) transhydrogenase (Re/Si-specific) subunit beta [Planctomycetota bacterium]|nr:NAD(P)(+) transhydrogenase (Re/Si-specific) subunit beta [Planctomycetota bacterium]